MLNDIKYCLLSTFKIHLIPCLFLFLFMYIVYYILKASIQPNSSAEKNIFMPWAIRQWFPIGSHLFIHVDDTEYNKLYTVDMVGDTFLNTFYI